MTVCSFAIERDFQLFKCYFLLKEVIDLSVSPGSRMPDNFFDPVNPAKFCSVLLEQSVL